MKKTIPAPVYSLVCDALAKSQMKTAIKVIDEKTIVKATWQFKPSGRNTREEMRVTIGEPDYRTKALIKAMNRAEKGSASKGIIFRSYPVKKT